MKKRYMLILILILAIGFASISTTLVITGIIGVGTKNDDFDVYFSGAILDTDDVSNEVIKSKKLINFSSKKLSIKDEETELIFEVTNGSKQYDADVSISCGIVLDENTKVQETDYIKILEYTNHLDIEAGKYDTGNTKAKLKKPAIEDSYVNVECTLTANAKERTSVGVDVEPIGEYSISGYFVNESGNAVSNAYLAVYSEVLHVVKTDMYGYFYVDGLERGMHEIYYLNTIDPTGMEKDNVVTQANGKVNVATNNEREINFTNDYKIVNNVVVNTVKNPETKYNITLNPNGGSVDTTTYEVEKNQLYGELPTPTKPGYNFNGWYLGEKLIDKDVRVTTNETHTLIASWSENDFTVTFNANGGSLENESDLTKTVTYLSSFGTLPEPTRENFTFIGWYKEESFITAVDENTTYNDTENITLYAKWDSNTKMYSLGNASIGKTYNIKSSYPGVDYTKLTANNFIVGAVGGASFYSSALQGCVVSYGHSTSGFSISKTYNSSTGVLTITGNNNVIIYTNGGNDKEYTQGLTIKVYMVTGPISTSTSSDGPVYYLGAGTSYNVKNIPNIDYTNITSDNFISVVTAGGSSSSYVGDVCNNEMRLGTEGFTISKTYNNSSGAYSFSGTSQYIYLHRFYDKTNVAAGKGQSFTLATYFVANGIR